LFILGCTGYLLTVWLIRISASGVHLDAAVPLTFVCHIIGFSVVIGMTERSGGM
jgi:hypothetical protein